MKKIMWLLVAALLMTSVPSVTAKADEKSYVSSESEAKTCVSEGQTVVKYIVDSARHQIPTDQAGDYVSVYVYGFNVNKDTVKPVFYDSNQNEITGAVKAVEKDKCGAHFRLEKINLSSWETMENAYDVELMCFNEKGIKYYSGNYQGISSQVTIYSPDVYYHKYDENEKIFTVYMSSDIELDEAVKPVLHIISQNGDEDFVVEDSVAESVIRSKNKFTGQYETKVSFKIKMDMNDDEWREEIFGNYMPKYQISYIDKNTGEEIYDSQDRYYHDPFGQNMLYTANERTSVQGNKDVILYYPYWVGGVYKFENTGTDSKYYISKAEEEYLEGDRYFLMDYEKGTGSLEEGIFQTKNWSGRAYSDAVFKYEQREEEFANVTLSSTKVVYTGKAVGPTVTVENAAGDTLEKDIDYKVTGVGTEVGRHTLTIEGIGSYTGTKELTYTIVPKKPASASVNLSTASGGYDDVKFTWKASTGATGYLVYYKKGTGSYSSAINVTGKTSYTKKNLDDGVKYTFKVVPYYKTASGSTKYYNTAQNTTATVYTLKKIAAPTLSKSGTKVKVKWNNINGETGYQISKSTSKTGTSIVATYKTTSGTSKLVAATKGKKYYYKVRAYKVVDGKKVYGPWSAVKAFTRK